MKSFPMSPSEYVFQAVANALHSEELEAILAGLILDGDLDQNQFFAASRAYPSIITKEMYEYLLPYFEE